MGVDKLLLDAQNLTLDSFKVFDEGLQPRGIFDSNSSSCELSGGEADDLQR
ncbi:unnamed protein product [Brassica rapa subsp. trilocularis]